MVLANQAAIATLLKMVVVRSNIVSISERGLGSGDSNMWDMNGNCVAEGKPFTECVVEHEFSKDIFLKVTVQSQPPKCYAFRRCGVSAK